MATPAIVQRISPATATGVASVSAAFGSNVTAGNALVAMNHKISTANRDIDISDDVNGAYTYQAATFSVNAAHMAGIGYCLNAGAGATEITWNIDVSTDTFRYMAFEVSDADEPDGGDANGFDVVEDEVGGTAQELFIPDETFSADSIVFGAFQHNADPGTITEVDGQTDEDTAPVIAGGFYSKIYSSGATEGVGWTNSTSRDVWSVGLSLKASGGGGATGSPFAAGSLGLMGVGL